MNVFKSPSNVSYEMTINIDKLSFISAFIIILTGLSGAYNAIGTSIFRSTSGPCLPYNETLVPLDTFSGTTGRKLLSNSWRDPIIPVYVDIGNGTGYWVYPKQDDTCGIWPLRELSIAGVVGGACLSAFFSVLLLLANINIVHELLNFVLIISAFVITGLMSAPLGIQIIPCTTPNCTEESFYANAVGFAAGPILIAVFISTNFAFWWDDIANDAVRLGFYS